MRIVAAIIATTLLAAMPLAHAQAPAPAAAPVPEVMPFDIPYGTPITLETAQKAIMAAAAEAKKHNWKMSITVVDPAGNLVAHATMDGTQYASIADLAGQGPHRRAVPPAVRRIPDRGQHRRHAERPQPARR